MSRLSDIQRLKAAYVLNAYKMYLDAIYYRNNSTNEVSLYTTVDQIFKKNTPRFTLFAYLELNGLILPPNPYIDPDSMFIDVEFMYIKPSEDEEKNKEVAKIVENLVPYYEWWKKDYPPSFVEYNDFKRINTY